MSDFDPNRDTQTSVILARFDDKGLWDKRNIDKLILTLLEQRDWHQSETAMLDLYLSNLKKRLSLAEKICESYYEWEWGNNVHDDHPKAFLLKEWYEEYGKHQKEK